FQGPHAGGGPGVAPRCDADRAETARDRRRSLRGGLRESARGGVPSVAEAVAQSDAPDADGVVRRVWGRGADFQCWWLRLCGRGRQEEVNGCVKSQNSSLAPAELRVRFLGRFLQQERTRD